MKREGIQAPIRVVFTDGGKGGVGRTEVAVNLVTWYRQQGIEPSLLDFGAEESSAGCLRSFFPETIKLDVHAPGALDHLFASVGSSPGVLLADMSAGASSAIRKWLERMLKASTRLNMAFTAVGVATNEPGSIESVIRSAGTLRNLAGYVVVLNQMSEPWIGGCSWKAGLENLNADAFITMRPRLARFQAKLRANALTLDAVAERRVEIKYFRYMMTVARARRYRKQIYDEFDRVRNLLLPSSAKEDDSKHDSTNEFLETK